ncbi:hypothetical protein CBOM_07567 [Ceraceosorus bombacis]|uniref:Uncharacterized protein n=1 Tax=Ceraceosorus bombacis TaxID=401625 RepID=A0A0N7L9T0_9BASI|nr:hypothetical protein CBOM_07567 [Ceraceosorus bombacis]
MASVRSLRLSPVLSGRWVSHRRVVSASSDDYRTARSPIESTPRCHALRIWPPCVLLLDTCIAGLQGKRLAMVNGLEAASCC